MRGCCTLASGPLKKLLQEWLRKRESDAGCHLSDWCYTHSQADIYAYAAPHGIKLCASLDDVGSGFQTVDKAGVVLTDVLEGMTPKDLGRFDELHCIVEKRSEEVRRASGRRLLAQGRR